MGDTETRWPPRLNNTLSQVPSYRDNVIDQRWDNVIDQNWDNAIELSWDNVINIWTMSLKREFNWLLNTLC